MPTGKTIVKKKKSKEEIFSAESFSEAMLFNSYIELCKYVNHKPDGGNSKIAFLKKIRRLIDLEHIANSQAYLVREVYDEPLEMNQSRRYKELLSLLLLDWFAKHSVETGRFKHYVTQKQLISDLSYVNEEYRKLFNNAKTVSIILGIPFGSGVVGLFLRETYQKMKAHIETALEVLDKKALMHSEMVLMVNSYEAPTTYKQASAFQLTVYEDAQRHAYSVLKIEKPGDMFYGENRYKWKEYDERVVEYLHFRKQIVKDMGESTEDYFDSCYKAYAFHYGENMEGDPDKLRKLFLTERAYLDFNQMFISICEEATTRQIMRMQNYNQELEDAEVTKNAKYGKDTQSEEDTQAGEEWDTLFSQTKKREKKKKFGYDMKRIAPRYIDKYRDYRQTLQAFFLEVSADKRLMLSDSQKRKIKVEFYKDTSKPEKVKETQSEEESTNEQPYEPNSTI